MTKPLLAPPLRPGTSKRTQRGFSLTELSIVLGVVGIIISAIWLAAGQVNSKARVTEAISQVNVVSQNMSSLLAGGYGLNAVSLPCGAGAVPCVITTKMTAAQVIPQQWWASCAGATCTEASSPWGGTSFNMMWTANSPRTYKMAFFNLSSLNECIGLVAAVTACTPGQPGCPNHVMFNCSAAAASTLTLTTAAITSANIQNYCALNTYDGSTPCAAGYENADGIVYNNSVEFDYTQ